MGLQQLGVVAEVVGGGAGDVVAAGDVAVGIGLGEREETRVVGDDAGDGSGAVVGVAATEVGSEQPVGDNFHGAFDVAYEYGYFCGHCLGHGQAEPLIARREQEQVVITQMAVDVIAGAVAEKVDGIRYVKFFR